MPDRTSDFRSDTVTTPTGSMLRAMASAKLGDDVFGDDPTVARLEEMAAERLGKEAALFVPSGTMGNLVGLLVHTRAGDEVLLEENAHSFHFEAGGAAAIAGVQSRPVPSDRGIPSLSAIERSFRPENVHFPRTRLLVYENTNQLSGGSIVPVEVMAEIRRVTRREGVAVHLDGARIWHAHVAAGVRLDEIASHADSVMCCLSKALSAPVGSLFVGSRDMVEEGRRHRKRLGGGMRQAGVLAAAGIVAIEEMIERLADDHRRARRLADGLAEIPGVLIEPDRVQTNIVFIRLTGARPRQDELAAYLEDAGVRVSNAWGWGIRFVTHRQISDADIEHALATMRRAHEDGLIG